jgi:hypothetical protein
MKRPRPAEEDEQKAGLLVDAVVPFLTTDDVEDLKDTSKNMRMKLRPL